MIVSWMTYSLGVAAFISIAAASAEWFLKSTRRPVRFVWVSAIAVTIVFTLLAPFRIEKPVPQFVLPNVSVTEVVSAVPAPTVFESIVISGRNALNALSAPASKLMSLANATPRSVNTGAAFAWIGSAALALIVLLSVYTRSMRQSASWPRMRLLGRSVRVAPDVGPAVMGMAPPEIVIPRWVLQRNTEEQRLVLEHESEHVRAHDPVLLVFACVAVALMPWNVAVWYMWSRLRLAVELDCDRRVLSRGVQKPAYGELLVELSSQHPWTSMAMPAFSWGTSHLEKRLVAMTALPVRFGFARRFASAAVVATALLAACNSEIPTAAEVAQMDVAAITARIPSVQDSSIYFVDGRAVSAADAKAVLADDISSIEVKRATKTKPVAEIYVTLADSTRKKSVVVSDSANTDGLTLLKLSPTISVENDSAAQKGGAESPTKTLALSAVREDGRGGRISVRPANGAAVAAPGEDASKMVVRSDECVVANFGPDATGNGSRIRIRGEQTPAACGEPMIVLDGVILSGKQLREIDPNQIESVEVLKGAAAQNLYGSRAMYGVISIKMKR